ncbi:SDR family NAD(P)-dependent oxidoreductase [Streptomyces griseorubiginosus]|uniref:SDR family NAD(P)-dependent oxidoreductase n=1 Tax=Streptomyces griseorubiginosus TaxID=67304 RepID=UPI003AF3B9FC|nr:SDR family NAD(P)-dependent oxidoreductase [Streptomyces griseorubiginosus]WUB51147.1 SDR family NAD(P)-dependent oxidoreductase [Streptomyces griseorubiginosus]
MRDLSGKVAFITGGASGIGLGMAKAFSRAGMKVVVVDFRDDHLAAAEETLARGGAEFHLVKLDVVGRAAWSRAADEAERVFSRIHVLCNNAGVGVLTPHRPGHLGGRGLVAGGQSRRRHQWCHHCSAANSCARAM